MRDFKFFQKGTVNMMDNQTHITASFNADTPEGHMSRRALYHTNPDLYDRLRAQGNEMELYFYERNLRHAHLTEQRREEITRGINEGRDLNDNPIRLFNTTTVTKSKVTLWSKFIDVMRESWRVEPIGVAFTAALATLITIVFIAKLLGA